MDTLQLTITLDATETMMLRRAAWRELRRPRDQARYLLRLALGLVEQPQETRSRGVVDPEQAHAAAAS